MPGFITPQGVSLTPPAAARGQRAGANNDDSTSGDTDTEGEGPLPALEPSVGAQQLSCILECARERMGNEDLETSITRASFLRVCTTCADVELCPEDVDGLHEVYDIAATDYAPFASESHPRQLTFRRLLDAFAPGYASTSTETRKSIEKVLLNAEALDVISRSEFYRDLRGAQRRAAVSLSVQEDRVLRSRTKKQVESLCPIDAPCPTRVVRESADAHAMRPFRASFAATCSRELRGLTRRLVAFFPLLALQIVALVVIANFGVPIAYSAGLSASDPVKDEWAVFCPPGAGPSSPECWFAKGTTPETLMRPDQIQWVVEQQVIRRQLWAGLEPGQPRADVPNLGSSLVGATILRTAPATLDETVVSDALNAAGSECQFLSCQEVGLSQPLDEFRIGNSFSCGAYALRNNTRAQAPYPNAGPGNPTAPPPVGVRSPLVIIPANATMTQASELIATFDPLMCRRNSAIGALTSTMVSVSYASYDPSAGVVTWVTLRITLPRTGHILVRVMEQPISTIRGWQAVVRLMGAQAIFVVFRFAAALYEIFSRPSVAGDSAAARMRKRVLHLATIAFELDNVMCAFQTILIFTALVEVKLAIDYVESAGLADSVTQVPAGMDLAAAQFEIGMSLIAFWLFFNTVFAASFFRDFIGLGRVVRVVQVAFADVGALLISFSVFVVAFVMVAMWLFGPKDIVFAGAATAMLEVLSVMSGGEAFVTMQEQSPIVGAVFYVAFVAFINFFALNLLVAVLTAPLPEVMDKANMHLEVFSDMVSREHDRLPVIPVINKELPLSVWSNMLMVTNVFTWSTMLFPFIGGVRRIRAVAADIEVVFGSHSRPMPQIIAASRRIMTTLYGPGVKATQRGPLGDAVRRYEKVDDDAPSAAGYNLLERMVLVQSGSKWMADARLLSILVLYDDYDTTATELLEDVEEHRKEATEAMNGLCEKAEEEAAAQLEAEQKRRESATYDPDRPVASVVVPLVARRRRKRHLGAKGTGSARLGEDQDLSSDDEAADTFSLTTVVSTATRRSNLRCVPPTIVVVSVLSIATIVLTLMDFGGNFEVAWTVSAMHSALRDSTMPTFCFDSACNTGQTYQKPFLEVANLEDFGDYVTLSLTKRLNLPRMNTTDAPATEESPRSVAWDDRLVMTGPVQVRQLRAAAKGCDLPSRGNAACHSAFGTYVSSSPLLTPAAPFAVFQSVPWAPDCPYSSSALGLRGDYPCEGYTVDIQYNDELEALVESWLDGQTRLVEVSIPIALQQSNYTGAGEAENANDPNGWIRLKYSLFVEWANGGGSARAWAWAVTPAKGLSVATGVAIALVAFDLVSWLGLLSWRMYRSKKTGKKLTKVRSRWSLIAMVLMLGLAAPLGYLLGAPVEERYQLFDPMLAVYSVWRLQTELIVPTLESLAPRSVRVLVLMKYAVGALPSVLPFFVLALFGFAIAGHVAFGRVVEEYSEMRVAILTTLRAMFTGMDLSNLVAARPLLAILFAIAFFAVVLVVLANIMLTAVTAAAEDSRNEMAPLRFIVDVAISTRFPVLRGRFFELFAAYHINARKRMRKSTSQVAAAVPLTCAQKVWTLLAKWAIGDRTRTLRSAVTITDRGRLPLPLECLVLANVGCYRIVELQKVFDMSDLPARSRFAAAFFVAQTAQTLYRRHGGALADDKENEVARLVDDGIGAQASSGGGSGGGGVMNGSLSAYPGVDSPLETTGTYDINPRLFDGDVDDDGQEKAEWSRASDGGYRPPPLGRRPHVQQRGVAETMAPLVAVQESGLFDDIGALTSTTTGSASTLIDRARNGGATQPNNNTVVAVAAAPPLQRDRTLPPDVGAAAKGGLESSSSEADFEGL